MPRIRLPVLVRGRVFASAHECAAHFNVRLAHVYRMVSSGRADFIGHGNRRGPAGKPCTVAGITFHSRLALAQAVGQPHKYTLETLRTGHSRRMAVLTQLVETYKTKGDLK